MTSIEFLTKVSLMNQTLHVGLGKIRKLSQTREALDFLVNSPCPSAIGNIKRKRLENIHAESGV